MPVCPRCSVVYGEGEAHACELLEAGRGPRWALWFVILVNLPPLAAAAAHVAGADPPPGALLAVLRAWAAIPATLLTTSGLYAFPAANPGVPVLALSLLDWMMLCGFWTLVGITIGMLTRALTRP
jgi:hypothetical protein